MLWEFALSGVVMIGAQALADTPRPAPLTYNYVITSPGLGEIGTYVRAVDSAAGISRAQSHLRIAVRVLGVAIYRENADQRETWRADRLVSFQSMSVINAAPLFVHGEVHDGRLMVTSPSGTEPAPADLSASDPWSTGRLGSAKIVSIKTGEIFEINTTGGERDKIMISGVSIIARHFRVSTATQPDRWELWLDTQGVPVKLRSREHGRAIDLNLVSRPIVITAGSFSNER